MTRNRKASRDLKERDDKDYAKNMEVGLSFDKGQRDYFDKWVLYQSVD